MVDAIVLFFEHDFFKLLDAQQTTEQEEIQNKHVYLRES